MGSTLTSSPNTSSSSVSSRTGRSRTGAKAKPKASTALALGVVAALLGGAFAGPASAKTTVQGGQNACKAAFQAQTPAPSSVRMDSSQTKAWTDTLVYAFKVKAAGSDKSSTVTCTVDRNTSVATLTAEAAQPTTLATR